MGTNLLFNVFQLLGGAGLFIFGMKAMTRSLSEALGTRLRSVITKSTRNQVTGLVVGTGAAFLIHSGAATVMVVNFVNAGLLELARSIGITIGANIGTTLSMQIVSFDLGKYCFVAIGIGFIWEMVSKNKTSKHIGLIIIGFGMLFLGMETMKGAMAAYKSSPLIKSMLMTTDATTVTGMVWGIFIATVITMILQSSGAMIGIIFAMASAGIATEFKFLFPLILGAHIGTCIVTVIGAIGTNLNAKRAAWAHVLFNVLGAVIAALMYPLYTSLIPTLSRGNLVREVANTHTLVQLINGIVFLILCRPFVRFLKIVIRSDEPEEKISFLSDELLITPENAIFAALRELSRMLEITRRMFRKMMTGFTRNDRDKFIEVEKDEAVVDNIKESINDFVVSLGAMRLSDRQSVMIQLISQAAADIERIGDHIESLVESTNLKNRNKVWFSEASAMDLIALIKKVDQIIGLTTSFVDPDHPDFKDPQQKIKTALNEYHDLSATVNQSLRKRIAEHSEQGIVCFFFMKYLTSFDKLVKHIRGIWHAESEELFFIKDDKMHQKGQKLTGQDLDTDSVIKF